MEQVEGGELHVNKGSTDQPSATSVNDEDRNLNAVEGWEVGHKMAQVEMDALLARHPPADAQSSSSGKSKANPDLPITICPVYLRIQPVLAPLPWHTEATTKPAAGRALFFLFHFRDPLHGLTHETLTQALPASWLDIPFEENEWVENEMVDVIRKGVELVGQVCSPRLLCIQADRRAGLCADETAREGAGGGAGEGGVAGAAGWAGAGGSSGSRALSVW
jgi:hypothetical protein